MDSARLQKPSWEVLMQILETSFTFAPMTTFPNSSTVVPHLASKDYGLKSRAKLEREQSHPQVHSQHFAELEAVSK